MRITLEVSSEYGFFPQCEVQFMDKASLSVWHSLKLAAFGTREILYRSEDMVERVKRSDGTRLITCGA